MGNYYFCFRVVTGYLNKIMDRGPWWDTVHRVAKSWTRLKQLSRNTHTHTQSNQKETETPGKFEKVRAFPEQPFPIKCILGRVSKRWGKVKVLLKDVGTNCS